MRPLWLLALALLSCLPRVGDPLDGGPPPDEDAGVDAGLLASCTDGLRNGLESDVDCGGSCAACALHARCDGPADCASAVCLSNRCAAPAQPCPAFYAGCSSFTDLTGAASRVVTFPNGNATYAPKCLRVRLGQTVTFMGDFGEHPLNQACGPLNGVLRGSGSSTTLTFDRALGIFGFYCSSHGNSSGSGMAGAIEVVR